MAEQAKVPEIRFAGFTDPWEQRKLGEIASFSKGSGYSKADIRESGIPLFLYGRMYTQYETRVDSVDTFAAPRPGTLYSKGTEIVVPASGESAEDIARASAITREGIALGGDLNVVYPQRMVTPLFLAYGLSHGSSQKMLAQKAQGKTVVHIHASDLKGLGIAFPDVTEQQAIGTFFSSLDDLITLHQRKYDKLVVFKKSMLEKMFPKDGESVPEIRFAGFTDPWEQRKLGELYEKNDERNTFGLGSERTLSIATMTFNSEGNGADASSLPNYKVIRVGDVAFEGHSNKSFAYGRFVVNAVADGIMSPRFSCLRPKNSYPVRFWKYYIHSEQVMREILVRATKSGTMMNELVIDDLFKQSIAVPQEAEQQAIGYFFSHLDDLITLHQRKLELLQNIKKSLLDKMFV